MKKAEGSDKPQKLRNSSVLLRDKLKYFDLRCLNTVYIVLLLSSCMSNVPYMSEHIFLRLLSSERLPRRILIPFFPSGGVCAS